MTRTLLALVALLATAAPASAAPTVLFEDASGDVGPWPTWILGQGAPAPGDADLVRATLDGARLRLEVASLGTPPADRIWTAGWSLDDERYVAVGYDTPGGEARPGACVWERWGAYGPEGEPECVAIEATVEPGTPGAFVLEVPEAFLAGGKRNVSGAVLLTPDGVAPPLVFLHYTGLTVVDVASGEDVAAPTAADPVATASVPEAPREVPAPAALAAGLAAAAVALARRR